MSDSPEPESHAPGFTARNGGLLRAEHNPIELALARREFAVHRNGARDVARVAIALRGGIDHHQLAAIHAPPVRHVVQDGAVRPGADDGRIGRPFAAPVEKGTEQRGGHLVFVLAGRQLLPDCAMGFDAHVGRVLDGSDLRRRLFHPQLGDERRRVGDVAEGIARPQLAGIGFAPGRVEACMGTKRQIQLRFQLLYRQDLFESGDDMRASASSAEVRLPEYRSTRSS